jgi:hypothetical protein
MQTRRYGSLVISLALAALACRSTEPVGFVGIQVIEDADRRSSTEPLPASSSIFDGEVVRLTAARGETVGITVWQGKVAAARGARADRSDRSAQGGDVPSIEAVSRTAKPVTLRFGAAGGPAIDALAVSGFEVEWLEVVQPSTTMYGGSRGAAWYPDALSPSEAPRTDPAYFDIRVTSDATPGKLRGQLRIGERTILVELTVSPAIAPSITESPWVWAYYDPRELAWHADVPVDSEANLAAEARCAAMFREHGVMATPELVPIEWPRRQAQVEGSKYVPVLLPSEPAAMAEAARFWTEALAPTDQLGFAIPIDEPRDDARRREVVALGQELQRQRGVGGRLLLAVTDVPRPIYGSAVDIFISPRAISRRQPATTPPQRWTYNGNPPYAGSMVVDAASTDLRTWGWIGFRWDVPLWYVWDALYWHDRHNAKRAGLPRPGRAMAANEGVTFNDGGDQGNRDGVLAVPGAPGDQASPCRPTLRLKTLRRGVFDRALLTAARCGATTGKADALAAAVVPSALADAFAATWSRGLTTERWTSARAELLSLAARCSAQ